VKLARAGAVTSIKAGCWTIVTVPPPGEASPPLQAAPRWVATMHGGEGECPLAHGAPRVAARVPAEPADRPSVFRPHVNRTIDSVNRGLTGSASSRVVARYYRRHERCSGTALQPRKEHLMPDWKRASFALTAMGLSLGSAARTFAGGDVPPPVATYFKQLAAGQYHTCALTYGGNVMCWGDGEQDQLGWTYNILPSYDSNEDWGLGSPFLGNAFGYYSAQVMPAALDIAGQVTAITAGDRFTCALTAQGLVQCWGYPAADQSSNTNGSINTVVAPIILNSVNQPAAQISAGSDFVCARTVGTGQVFCWQYYGDDAEWQLGTIPPGQYEPPPLNVSSTASQNWYETTNWVSGIVGATDISAAGGWHADGGGGHEVAHACAIQPFTYHTFLGNTWTTHTPVCWGDDYFGELEIAPPPATGFTDSQLELPQKATYVSDAVAISSNKTSTCAISTSQGVICWGDNHWGQLANSSCTNSCWQGYPVQFASTAPQTKPVALASRNDTACAIYGNDPNGSLYCWGFNFYGQTSDANSVGAFTTKAVQVPVTSPTAVAVGDRHACAIVNSGEHIMCWGNNEMGQTGWYHQGKWPVVYPAPYTPTLVTTP
jgi:alpha-tubulin suppressor-like RCC1 family protein